MLKAEKISNTAYSFTAINPTGLPAWYFEDGTVQYGMQMAHNFKDVPAVHQVKVYTSRLDNGCNDSAFLKIVVSGPKPRLTNAFTPNGDGYNDEYYVDIKNADFYELTIMDLQNRIVFSTQNPDLHWDGSCKNIQCLDGKYQVLFSYKYPGEAQPTVLREILILTRNNK